MSETIEEYCNRLTPLILDGLQKGWPSFEWKLECEIDLLDIEFHGYALAVNGKRLEEPYMCSSPSWFFYDGHKDEFIISHSVDVIGAFAEMSLRRLGLLM